MNYGSLERLEALFPEETHYHNLMLADADGYFRAPATAPVGSRVPVEITYDDRHSFDNLILVRVEESDGALSNPSGRNTHTIGDADTVYRRAGDKPGLYELRLRRHAGFDRRNMARQQIEIVDIDIDLQVPDAVAPRETFEVRMDPVMAGHLVVLPRPTAIRRTWSIAIRAVTMSFRTPTDRVCSPAPHRAIPASTRFAFTSTPRAREGEVTGRNGRLIARATLNVVDAYSLAQMENEPEPGPGPEPEIGSGSDPDAEAGSETIAAQQNDYTED